MGMLKRIKKKVNLLGSRHQCCICGAKFGQFLPFRHGVDSLSPVLRQLRVVGSDVTRFACPVCRCTDRERHLSMYFDALALWDAVKGARVLHLAPEAHIAKRIAALAPLEYVRGDLFPETPDVVRVDITQMPFPDNHFDVLICNHVLEHVPDDRGALNEVLRVLKTGGFAVLQTPYSPVLQQSWEDEGIQSAEDRWFCYGQEDHVRLYGNDLFDRITEVGLSVERKYHADVLQEVDAMYCGVNDREELLLAYK